MASTYLIFVIATCQSLLVKIACLLERSYAAEWLSEIKTFQWNDDDVDSLKINKKSKSGVKISLKLHKCEWGSVAAS